MNRARPKNTVAAVIARPASSGADLQQRQFAQVDVAAQADDLLHGRRLDLSRRNAGECGWLRAALEPLEPALGRCRVKQPGDSVGHLIERGAPAPADSPLGAQQVAEYGQIVAFDRPEQQGRAPRLGRSGDNLGRFQRRIDLILHPGYSPAWPNSSRKSVKQRYGMGTIVRGGGRGVKAAKPLQKSKRMSACSR